MKIQYRKYNKVVRKKKKEKRKKKKEKRKRHEVAESSNRGKNGT
jgi:hypothetical protein